MRQKLVLLLVTFIVAASLVGAGVLTGYYLRDKRFQRPFREAWKAETLGRILGDNPETLRAASQAYLNPAAALEELDGFSWSPPVVPTPFVGVAPAPGRNANAAINSFQFRNYNDAEMPKPSGVKRVFLIGGSTAFGVGASAQDRTIGGYLEQTLNRGAENGRRYQVFTFACPSWASTHERIAVENRLSELEPDWIVALTGANDVHWGRMGRNVLWFRTYQDQMFWMLIDNSYRAFGHGALADVEDRRDSPIESAVVAKRFVHNHGLGAASLPPQASYLVALQPTLYSTSKALSVREQGLLNGVVDDYFDRCYQVIRQRIGSLERPEARLTFLDLSGAFDSQPASDEIFLDSYHFGDRGNRLLAERLAEALLRPR